MRLMACPRGEQALTLRLKEIIFNSCWATKDAKYPLLGLPWRSVIPKIFFTHDTEKVFWGQQLL